MTRGSAGGNSPSPTSSTTVEEDGASYAYEETLPAALEGDLQGFGVSSPHPAPTRHLSLLLDSLAARVGTDEALSAASFVLTGERLPAALAAARVLSTTAHNSEAAQPGQRLRIGSVSASAQPSPQAQLQGQHSSDMRGSDDNASQHITQNGPNRPPGRSFSVASLSPGRLASNKVAPEESAEDLDFGAREMSFSDLVHALTAARPGTASSSSGGMLTDRTLRALRAQSMIAACPPSKAPSLSMAASIHEAQLAQPHTAGSPSSSAMVPCGASSMSATGPPVRHPSQRRWRSETNVTDLPPALASRAQQAALHQQDAQRPADALTPAVGMLACLPAPERSGDDGLLGSTDGAAQSVPAGIALPGMADGVTEAGSDASVSDGIGKAAPASTELGRQLSPEASYAAPEASDAAERRQMLHATLQRLVSRGTASDPPQVAAYDGGGGSREGSSSLAATWAQIAQSRTARGSGRMGWAVSGALRQGSASMMLEDADAQESSMLPVLSGVLWSAADPTAVAAAAGAAGGRLSRAASLMARPPYRALSVGIAAGLARPATTTGMIRQAHPPHQGARGAPDGAHGAGSSGAATPSASLPTEDGWVPASGGHSQRRFASMPLLMEEPERTALRQGLAVGGGLAVDGGLAVGGGLAAGRSLARGAGSGSGSGAHSATASPRSAAGLLLAEAAEHPTHDSSGTLTHGSLEPGAEPVEIVQGMQAAASTATALPSTAAGPVAEGTEEAADACRPSLAAAQPAPPSGWVSSTTHHGLVQPSAQADARVHTDWSISHAQCVVWSLPLRHAVLCAVLSMARALEAMAAEVVQAAAQLQAMQAAAARLLHHAHARGGGTLLPMQWPDLASSTPPQSVGLHYDVGLAGGATASSMPQGVTSGVTSGVTAGVTAGSMLHLLHAQAARDLQAALDVLSASSRLRGDGNHHGHGTARVGMACASRADEGGAEPPAAAAAGMMPGAAGARAPTLMEAKAQLVSVLRGAVNDTARCAPEGGGGHPAMGTVSCVIKYML